MLQKTDVEGFVKDKKTGAVLNTNTGEYTAYRKQKQFYREFNNMKSAIEDMQQQIIELQDTVEQLKRK